MTRPPQITCLFFSDATVGAFLATAAGREFGGDLLIECGQRPALSYLLNVETPLNYPGLAGLLGGVDIGALAHPSEKLPAPILFAAGAPVSPLALRSALPLLRRPDERLAAITLLVAFADARELGAALSCADRFAIAWDVDAYPHEELGAFAKWVGQEKLLTTANFAGLFPYGSAPLDPAQQTRLSAALRAFGTRFPTVRSEPIATAPL